MYIFLECDTLTEQKYIQRSNFGVLLAFLFYVRHLLSFIVKSPINLFMTGEVQLNRANNHNSRGCVFPLTEDMGLSVDCISSTHQIFLDIHIEAVALDDFKEVI